MPKQREITYYFGGEKLPPINLVLTLPNAKENSLMKPSGPNGYFEGNVLIMNSVISFHFISFLSSFFFLQRQNIIFIYFLL